MSDKNDSPKNNCYKSTPNNRKVRNPFDKVLIEKLHKPICSPGMCKIYKKKKNCSFRWDIDQKCTLVPEDIVACNSQFEPSPDPALERIAEEATERFFSQEMVMPSPLESSKKEKPLLHTSSNMSINLTSFTKEKDVILKDVSAQTVLTLPPELPPEIQKILQPFCTFTQDQNISGDYEITANGSLRRKLFFEEHSDMEHYDSEQTDDEHIDHEPRPPSSYEAHTPVIFSPDLSRDLVTKGMKRTFGTPLRKGMAGTGKSCFRNKILDVVDFGEPCFSPIHFQTPKRADQESVTSSSLASASISPLTKATSSDEEKNNFTSPESEAMATCLECINTEPKGEKKGPCFCKTPYKSVLKRSNSLKDSPPRSRKASFSFSERRSLSLSSLHRSRSVQKLDFSMDISVDGSFHENSQADSESTPVQENKASWSIVEEASFQHLVKAPDNEEKEIQSSTKIHNFNVLDETPIKGKQGKNVVPHEISKIRGPVIWKSVHMSLDNSLDNFENPLCMEDKKIDFNTVDLNFLTENASQFDCTNNVTKVGDSSTSFKRVDSGFNENTFYTSSYYESAIKPSELTVTNVSKPNNNKTALKEISNVQWMRVDSGFKEESSADNTQFYHVNDSSIKKATGFRFSEAKIDENKENLVTENFDRFFVQSNKNEAMSMSDIFHEEMSFNCNFSSTPSKNKSRQFHQ